MVHHGDLTSPEDPRGYLKIPNKIAEKRIIQTVINKFVLNKSLEFAVKDLIISGDITKVLRCSQDLMIRRDAEDFNKSEENHRDGFYSSLIQNYLIDPHPEYKVTKVIKCFS